MHRRCDPERIGRRRSDGLTTSVAVCMRVTDNYKIDCIKKILNLHIINYKVYCIKNILNIYIIIIIIIIYLI